MAGDKDRFPPQVSAEQLQGKIAACEEENATLRESHRIAIHYIRTKIDQLLSVMGTKPLRAQELSDDTLISFDPIGIISDSFTQILGHLHTTNEELRHARDAIQAIFESAGAGICVLDREMRVMAYNQRLKEMFFPDRDEVIGLPCNEVTCGEPEAAPSWCTYRLVVASRTPVHQRDVFLCGRHFDVVGTPIRDAAGELERVVLTYTDITNYKLAERKNRELQVQLLQSQKMESLGRLAGGIAHDFNNILTTVIGFSEIVLLDIPPNTEMCSRVSTIKEAGEKAASLVNQLLAFSRKQVLDLEVVDLNQTVGNIGKMLERLIGENVRLEIRTKQRVRNIMADRGQVEQVLVNLVVNARDALGGRGTVTVRTENVEVDPGGPEIRQGVPPGDYVVLCVEDDGAGMPESVAARIFEPFFTTKEAGKGTGLGLATVYGIVRQHGGQITVATEEGKGSSFAVYFPATDARTAPVGEMVRDEAIRGTETILLVEDEELTRRMLLDALKALGYTVLEARDGFQALDVAETMHDSIDLVLSDVVMPGMNGWELVAALREKIPGVRVLYMSGYSGDELASGGAVPSDITLLQKPFNLSLLAEKVRQVLG